MTVLILESLLTCPICGLAETLIMPTEACQWFYECPACKNLLKPKPGDCCVFCSYGSAPCPVGASAGWDGLLRLKESTRHPSPASAIGFLISTRLLHSMWRDGLKRGIVTLCIGGGQGIALVVESL